jgi:hypothetical protein
MANVLFLAQETVNTSHLVYWFNQGFAVLVVIALGWAVYGWIRWAGVNLLVPLKDAGIEHLRTTTDTMKSVQTTLADTHTNIQEIKHSVGNLDRRTDAIAATVEHLKTRQT